MADSLSFDPMTVQLSMLGGAAAQFFDNNGSILSGGKLYTYTAGTTTPQATYTNNTGITAHTNPIILDSVGRLPGGEIWLSDNIAYKFIVKTSYDVIITSYDNITGNGSGILSSLAESSGASLIGYTVNGTGAVATDVQTKLRETVSVKDFGAVGDGVTDDTAALIAAEAYAYAANATLYVPGGTYNFNGAWTVRVNLSGYGAKIQQIATTYSANATAVIIVGADDIVIQGIAVDGNLYRTGFSSYNIDGFTLRDCVAKQCINGGYISYYGNNILLDRCYAEDVRYQPTNSASDGFIFFGCTRSTWRDCEANNFRRIGFVSEGDNTIKSEQITALRCIAHNANNCDDSSTEYNAAFWAENTNSIDWVDCVGYDLAGNSGQTSGRVIGMVGFASGNNKVGTANLIRCRIYGGNGYIPVGITATGSLDYATVNITDCYVEEAKSAFASLCGLKALNITRFNMNNIVNSLVSQGGFVFDATGGTLLENLVIDTIVHQNCTFNAGSGLVKFFVTPTNCNYIFKNTNDATHVMAGPCNSIAVNNCKIACGSDIGIGSFAAASVVFDNCLLTSRNNSNNDQIVQTSSLASRAKIVMTNCTVSTSSGYWTPESGGTNIYVYCDNVKFFNFGWPVSVIGDYQIVFSNCQVYDVPPTVGFVYTNFNVPTKQVLIVQNCYFQAVNAANTPLRKWNTDPTNSIIQGNIYRNITSLYDFTSGVTQANNISI